MTETPTTFSALGVSEDLCARLAERNRTEPFPIQAEAIPPALAGNDVSGKAPTGSGKTLAFGLPIAQRVGRARPGRPQALVLAPTRELAAQIETELRPLLAVHKRSVASFYGGIGFGQQLKALRRGVDVAVGCPGRVADLVKRGDLVLEEVGIVVIDEADRMADMGFLPEVRRLLDRVRPKRQTLLFSATLDGDVDVLVRNYQRNPVRVEVAPPERGEDRTEHRFVQTVREKRIPLTASLVGKHGSTVVFCRTKRGVDRVAKQLATAGVSTVAIHGDRTQKQREKALAFFQAGKAMALVATDVAARGIHVDDVGCVVHFDIPADAKDYLHRSGRTGRAGAAGVVVAFVMDDNHAKVRELRKALGMPGSDGTSNRPERGRPSSGPSRGNGRRPGANPRGGRRRPTKARRG
ncbi:MAG: DEAD/DEAH box helicase [Acidimicrobiia bacterium]|nr:DEAD/DEAH box helicase [Acidimicrobiia bacterium]